MTFIVYYLLFLFAVVKFSHLLTKHNPQIVEYEETDALDSTDVYNPGEAEDFMIAVGLFHFLTGEPINDPRYIKWINMFSRFDREGFTPINAYNLHPCTEEDYKRFYPPEKQAEDKVEELKRSNGLFCMDFK